MRSLVLTTCKDAPESTINYFSVFFLKNGSLFSWTRGFCKHVCAVSMLQFVIPRSQCSVHCWCTSTCVEAIGLRCFFRPRWKTPSEGIFLSFSCTKLPFRIATFRGDLAVFQHTFQFFVSFQMCGTSCITMVDLAGFVYPLCAISMFSVFARFLSIDFRMSSFPGCCPLKRLVFTAVIEILHYFLLHITTHHFFQSQISGRSFFCTVSIRNRWNRRTRGSEE